MRNLEEALSTRISLPLVNFSSGAPHLVTVALSEFWSNSVSVSINYICKKGKFWPDCADAQDA